jgi:putative hydrolase of the HAD superfamily
MLSPVAGADRLGPVTPHPALKHLLLDFGGPVLLTPFELTEKASATLGPITWRGPFDPATDAEYVRWQRGDISERDYWTIRAGAYGLDIVGLMRHFYEPAGDELVRPEMAGLIVGERARGRVVGVLTNDMGAFHGPEWRDGISILKELDFLVDGSVTGFLKPDRRAYAAALEVLGDPDPADVVFVDDQPANVRGAEAVGLRAVFFDPTDVPGTFARIDAALN